MAMLAEPRRKQKWTLNPRGKQWSDDTNKFGQKMLEKFGWTSGKGLGAKEQGMVEHVRVKFKDDSAGIGFSKDDQDNNWTEHQESFNELLAKLGSVNNSSDPTIKTEHLENNLSGVSLEQKSKQSRARVHYRKFTRGKDVNKYSAKDLANIFGKKDLSDNPVIKKEIKEEPEVNVIAPIGTADTTGGVLTYKGGNMSDYFKNKLGILSTLSKQSSDGKNDDDESENERYVGFGFSSSNKSVESSTNNGTFAFVNPAMDTNDDNTQRKRKSEFYFDNPALDLDQSDHKIKKRKTDYSFDNSGLNLDQSDLKPIKMEFIKSENLECIPQSSTDTTESIKKKKKKKNKNVVENGIVNDALDLDIKNEIKTDIICDDYEVSRADVGLTNNALDLTDEKIDKKRVTFNDKVEFNTDLSKKKKSKVKLDKFEVDNEKLKKKEKKKKKKKDKEQGNVKEEENHVFINEALDVEIINEEINDNEVNERKSKKSKKKKNKRMSNLETIEEAPEQEKEEIIKDLTENDLEPPQKKKNKNKANHDVMNVSIEVIEVEDSHGVPPAKKIKTEENNDDVVEIICIDEETKKKQKKKKKKNKEADNIEVIKIENGDEKIVEDENSNKENNEDACDGGKKKSKKNKKNKKSKNDDNDSKSDEVINKNDDEKEDSIDETQDTTKGAETPNKNSAISSLKEKLNKKLIQQILLKTPIVEFSGSNINEIKGYGVGV